MYMTGPKGEENKNNKIKYLPLYSPYTQRREYCGYHHDVAEQEDRQKELRRPPAGGSDGSLSASDQ